MLQVLIVNKKRFLINTESAFAENICQDILLRYGRDAVIDWEEPTLQDVL
jgi:hypothetical protein